MAGRPVYWLRHHLLGFSGERRREGGKGEKKSLVSLERGGRREGEEEGGRERRREGGKGERKSCTVILRHDNTYTTAELA